MKQFITAMCFGVIAALPAFSQTKVEDFRQPFAYGQLQPTTPNFTGSVWLSKVSQNDSLKLPAFNVTFAPGCINAWHYHTHGQVLVATAGSGFYQAQGQPVRALHAGDIVEIAPNVVHWHGAAPDSWFAHVAIMPNPDENKTHWLAPIGDAAYQLAIAQSEAPHDSAQQSLSPTDLAIVDLGTYTAKGDLLDLRRAIVGAFAAGMTQNEIKEVLIHAYSYCGFPRSLRAIQTMMEVVAERKAKGINDPIGKESSPIKGEKNKYRRGQQTLSQLTGIPVSNQFTGYAAFAPTIERFLKEHLFADIFDRDVLTYRQRELATVSMLAGLGGVEPMARGHLGICLHLGVSPQQLNALFDRVAQNIGQSTIVPLRAILKQLETT